MALDEGDDVKMCCEDQGARGVGVGSESLAGDSRFKTVVADFLGTTRPMSMLAFEQKKTARASNVTVSPLRRHDCCRVWSGHTGIASAHRSLVARHARSHGIRSHPETALTQHLNRQITHGCF